MNNQASEFIDRLKRVCGTPRASRPVQLHETFFAEAEKRQVMECLDDGRVSTAGVLTGRLEALLQEYCGCKYVVATSSGTAALHLALLAHGIGAGDEVLVPSFAYIAPVNAIIAAGGMPHFVDCEPVTHGIDPERLRLHLSAIARRRGKKLINRQTGQPIRAIIPVYANGMPCRIDELRAIAREFHLELIEDAAEALASQYKNQQVGTFGTGILSFNGNKIVTSAGGGALLTNDAAIAQRARRLAHMAKVPHPFEYRYAGPGLNYGMPSLNAALLLGQMSRIDALLNHKRTLAKAYRNAFDGSPLGGLLLEGENMRSNYWQNVFCLHPRHAGLRNQLIEAAQAHHILCRASWTPLHQQKFLRDCPRDEKLSGTLSLSKRTIALPSSTRLGAQCHDAD